MNILTARQPGNGDGTPLVLPSVVGTKVEELLDYQFQNLTLLIITDLIVSVHFFLESNVYNPGTLKKLRSAITNNNTLGALAVKCGHDTEIKNQSTISKAQVEAFALPQHENGHPLPNDVSG